MGGGTARKLSDVYRADYLLFDDLTGLPASLIEIKWRNHAYRTYPDVWQSLDKFLRGRQLADMMQVPFVFAVQWKNRLGMATLGPRYAVSWNGRTDRGDPADMEPVIRVPIDNFVLI
jgi:hypothetical protein